MKKKNLSLSLFNGSGKGYKLLNKILQKMPFYPGINKHIFNSLKKKCKENEGSTRKNMYPAF